MYETYDDDELDGKLALLGAPADAAPVARAAQILAMTAPVVTMPRASGVPRWVLGGSVAAALGVGFAGGIVVSALRLGLLPSSERTGDVSESTSVAALNASDVPPTTVLSASSASSASSAALSSLAGVWLSPASPVLPDSLSPSSPTERSLPPRRKTHRSPVPTPEFGAVSKYRDPPAPVELPSTPVDPEELALDDVPSSPPQERIGRMAPHEDGVLATHEVTIPGNGHSPWSIVADGGAAVFDRPAEGIGVSGGLLGAAGARFSPRTAGLVQPAAEARVSLFGGLVPAPGPVIFSPDFHAELVWAAGVVRPVLGWGMAVQFPLAADHGEDRRGPVPETHARNEELALFTTGPELGLEIGAAEHVHARIRAELEDSPARIAESGFRPSGSVTAGVEFPLGTQ